MIIPTMRPAAAVVIRWLVNGSMMSGRRGDQQQRDEGEGKNSMTWGDDQAAAGGAQIQ